METNDDARLQIMSSICAPLFLCDVNTLSIVWANESALDFWGVETANELYQLDFALNASHTAKVRLQQILQMCEETKTPLTENWTVYPDKQPRLTEFRISAFKTLSGHPLLLMHAVSTNATADTSTAYRTTALMHTSTMISAYDTELTLVYGNTAARASIPESLKHFSERLTEPAAAKDIVSSIDQNGSYTGDVQVLTLNGTRWHALHIQKCTDPTTGKVMYLITETDITEARHAKAEAHRLAYTDSLTGLPNRTALNTHLEKKLSSESLSPFAILFIDLDRFKTINDSLGHAVGDQLLINIGQRLSQAIGSCGSVYRLGGDEFVIVATSDTSNAALKRIAQHILFTMATPVFVSGNRLRVLPSIGISVYPKHGEQLSTLVDHADAAMYIAKENQCGFCFYDEKVLSSISANVKDRMGLENDMISAMQSDEFELYFQPKVACQNYSARSVEALIRWHHPKRGLVPPDKFIGIAEETGQIVDLGNWVLVSAMRQQRQWQEEGLNIPISVNISARQFCDNDLLADVSQAIKITNCQPHMIELEITESMLIGEPDHVYDTLQSLSAMGIRLALDDFGTGYSNLAYLQTYPLDCLKIDRIFLADRKRSLLMRTILQMARVLGLDVVAEGVETAQQADWLTANGCDLMQGFYFSRPLPVAEITQYLRDNGAPRISGRQAA